MDSDAGVLCGIVAVVVLFLVDFIFMTFLSALQTVTDAEIEELSEKAGRSMDTLNKLKDEMDHLMHTGWLLHALMYSAAAWLLHTLSAGVSFFVLYLAAVVLFYLFGNSIPEMLGRWRAQHWVARWSGSAARIVMILRPFTYVMAAISRFCIRLFGVAPKSLETEVTENEIISMVNEGHEQGVLDAKEAEMIQNIFELDDKNASDIMTHRKKIIGIEGKTSLQDAITFMAGEAVSRFPVYEGSIDNIIGLLHFKDAMKFHTMEQYDTMPICEIPDLLRQIRFIPETRGINDLFRKMQAEKQQMVIVVDEYGQTAGLVAMEDILEEIVGNIQDEYDNDIQMIRECRDGSFLMDGMTPLTEVEDVLEIRLEEEDYDTLNGWLISLLDRIPADGERVKLKEKGYLFHIIKVEKNMIRLVKITKLIEKEKE